MDAEETLNRLFRRRRYLAVIAVVLGAVVFALFHSGTHTTYRAESRLLLGPELNSSQEAQAVVSRARAIATSSEVLGVAIKQAQVPRSVSEVRAEVVLSGVGDSGLAQLAVTDRDPVIAATLCRALGHATTDFINRTNSAPISTTLASVETQLQDALAQYAQEESRASGPTSQAQLAAITENINSLSTARGQLLARQAQAVAAAVVDEPAAQGIETTSNVLPFAGLAVVATILLWLLAHAIAEALRPMLPTPRAVARAFDAPVLGRVRADLAAGDTETAQTLDRVVLSAHRLDANTLVTGGGRAATPELISLLDQRLAIVGQSAITAAANPLPALAELAATASVGTRTNGRAKPLESGRTSPTAQRNGRVAKVRPAPHHVIPVSLAHRAPPATTGVLVVTRAGATRAELQDIAELLRCTHWPVVGIVEVVKASSRRQRHPDE